MKKPWKLQNAISKNRALHPEAALYIDEMLEAYLKAKPTGLKNIRLGNLGVFIHNERHRDFLMANIDTRAQ